MNIRCGKYSHLRTEKKCKNYKNISIEFTREEFKNWCKKNEKTILSLKRPSIDRINNYKNYSLDNIQVIELKHNIRKDKTVFNDVSGVCFRCKKSKPLNEFVKDNRRQNGLTNICKKCENLRNKARYEQKKILRQRTGPT